MRRHLSFLAAAGLLASATGAVRAEPLPNARILRSINQSVYEVVIPKPENDPLTYEKPLPFDLLPFKLRNDKYHSVGSAFAVNDSLLITAAHVLGFERRTRMAPHCVRDAGGKVYAIRNVVMYSSRRDVVAFTIEGGAPLKPLPVRPAYRINQSVFAVGNAMGEGTVIRDGLLTSTSPEPEDGLFEELRFSAAASPGNSGGPLLNTAGEVIGMVVRKSENENLNYALPIKEALALIGKPAEIHHKLIYALPNSNFQKLGAFNSAAPLPLPQREFRERLSDAFIATSRALLDSVIIENRDRFFPRGSESQDLLHTIHTSVFPSLVAQGKDNTWDVFGPKERKSFDLDDNGKLSIATNMFGYEFFRLDLPDSLTVTRICDDDTLLMDLLLKGIYATRDISNSETRIISFGGAVERGERRDGYGRRWIVRGWHLPHSDEEALLYALPVPSGLVGFLRCQNLGQMESGIRPDMEYLTDHAFVSYYGTLSRWEQFLRQPALLPDALRSFEFSYVPHKKVALRTARVAVDFPASIFPVTAQSDLQLKFVFFPDSGRVVWDIAGFVFGEDKNNNNVATLLRYIKPGKDVTEDTKSRWTKIAYQQYPYDQTPSLADDRTLVMGPHPAYKGYGPAEKLGRPVLYTTSVSIEGKQDDGDMKSKLKKFNNSVTILEH